MRLGLLAGLGAAVALLACGGSSGHAKVSASASDDDTKTQSTFSASGQTDPNLGGSKPEASPSAEPAMAPTATMPTGAADAPPPSSATCPLVCFVANKGRAAPDDEARLAGQLSGILGALRTCGNGQNSLTMRFDSSSALTEFGVDAERGNEGNCVEAIRQQRPAVNYVGPATLRCSEKCGGATTTTRKRRGR